MRMIWISLAVIFRKVVIVRLDTVYTTSFVSVFSVVVVITTPTTLVSRVLLTMSSRFVIVCLDTVYATSITSTRFFTPR